MSVMALTALVRVHTTSLHGADVYYTDYTGQLCYFDGSEDWFVNEDGSRRVADWFWYL